MHRDTPVGVRHPTPTEQLVALVEVAGGLLDRAEAMRQLACIRGVKSTRVAVGLALLDGRLELDADDVLHVVEEEEDRCS